jgi:pimeloyl-ACP methyl ester carboxylesterase
VNTSFVTRDGRRLGIDDYLTPQLAAIRAPTLVVTGDHDFFGTPAADEIAAGIPDTRLVVLQSAGHFAWVDAPERFREEVGRFLSG